MESLITLYTEMFNSMEGYQKALFVFWSLCVVLFFTTFTFLILMSIKEGIVTMFKKSPRPQRF